MAEFYCLPGETPHIDTVMQPGGVITAVILPAPVGGQQRYRKVRDHASYAFALASVAVIAGMDEGRISYVALAFGGVAAQPWRTSEIEDLLTRHSQSEALFAEAADILPTPWTTWAKPSP